MSSAPTGTLTLTLISRNTTPKISQKQLTQAGPLTYTGRKQASLQTQASTIRSAPETMTPYKPPPHHSAINIPTPTRRLHLLLQPTTISSTNTILISP